MADSLQEALEALNEATALDSTYAALVINNDLRTITVPPNFIFGVYNDKNVLSIDFEMPRYYDDIDLSTFSIQINYLSASNVGNIYEVENPVVEEDKITFEWLLDRGVFLKAGDVTFIVCLRLTGEGGAVIQEFNTTVAKGTVLEGLEVEDPEDPEAYSIIAHLREIDTRVTAQARQVATDCAAIGSIAAEAQEALDEANAGIAEIKEKYGSPLVAPTASGMLDHNRIYVYTGSETGYTFGNWYYWDGTAWTSGGVYNSAGVNTDSTLSVSGMPADAKKTGDEISGLKEDLSEKGLSDNAKAALLACFAKVAWIDEHGQDYYDALEDALYPSQYPKITATFNPGVNVIYTDDTLNSLKQYLTVKYYETQESEGTTVSSSDYTLSGVLVEGTSIIYVAYGNLTTSFVINGVVDFYNVWKWTTANGVLSAVGNVNDSFTTTIVSNPASANRGIAYLPRGKGGIYNYNGNNPVLFNPMRYPIPIPNGATKVTVDTTSGKSPVNSFYIYRYTNGNNYTYLGTKWTPTDAHSTVDISAYTGSDLFFVPCFGVGSNTLNLPPDISFEFSIE